ncbi:carbonic anhydrase-like protein [Cotia virus SPAn232]|uniref:Cell surface-binding protein OPG105 n=2 Tax=Cotia virus TaxID=39444 RepID=H6TAK0_9POXV|nr:carbonic anhydrase-like protein [Cotia virus SPAn232]AFB76937.1 carbonic anhydrase-like protein [Cotia virus SPAn232]AIT70717.1 carbonic anhydrase-like protein [Cotia virus]
MQQSPIDIINNETIYKNYLSNLQITYNNKLPSKKLINDGRVLKIIFDDKSKDRLTINQGPLSNIYIAKEAHFHWGYENFGSEHLVDGFQYACELQIIHWNKIYNNFEEALTKDKGIAIVSILFNSSDNNNDDLEEVFNKIPSITKKNTSIDLKNFDLTKLLPNCLDYWTYNGSLTYDTFKNNVTWIIFKKPINIGIKQIHEFRKLTNNNDNGNILYINNNFRHEQNKIKDLKIYSSNPVTSTSCNFKNPVLVGTSGENGNDNKPPTSTPQGSNKDTSNNTTLYSILAIVGIFLIVLFVMYIRRRFIKNNNNVLYVYNTGKKYKI